MESVFRRNKEGDRDRALETVLQIISDNTDGTVSPDVVCLAGRIYKDKFINSNYEDRESLDKAIEWYRKAFDVSPLEYSGINLTTLLRARGETFENNSEMQQIGRYCGISYLYFRFSLICFCEWLGNWLPYSTRLLCLWANLARGSTKLW